MSRLDNWCPERDRHCENTCPKWIDELDLPCERAKAHLLRAILVALDKLSEKQDVAISCPECDFLLLINPKPIDDEDLYCTHCQQWFKSTELLNKHKEQTAEELLEQLQSKLRSGA